MVQHKPAADEKSEGEIKNVNYYFTKASVVLRKQPDACFERRRGILALNTKHGWASAGDAMQREMHEK